MIVSELKLYNFRKFKSVDGIPGLQITFHRGLNALIGENDSGKTAVIDALKLVLLTQSNEYIRPLEEDFYKPIDGDACSEFKIDCTITDFNQNEAKNFIEYLMFKKSDEKVECRIFHYAKVKHPLSDRDFSVITIKKFLNDEYQNMYRQWYLELSMLQDIERETIDCFMRQKINGLYKTMNSQASDIFDCLPKHFLDEDTTISKTDNFGRNIFIDPIRGRKIEFDTIHGVKGETHDATLYLETDRQGASDLNRILPYYGVGKIGKSNLYDYSRKLAYVGMSRPKKLLCVAMQAKTYEKSKGVFDEDWKIIDLRG